MITVLFKDYHVEIPFPAVPIQLLTAMRIGLQRIATQHGPQEFEGLQVRLNGERKSPSEAQTILEDGSCISIIPSTVHELNKDRIFMLDL